jgi:hypothetical protein
MSRMGGTKLPYIHGAASAKPLRTRLNCRVCSAPLDEPRPEFDWRCDRCLAAERATAPKRDLRRTTMRPIR